MILANVKYHEQRAAPGVYKIVFIKTKVFRNFAIAGSVICQITQWVLIILGMANTSQIILKTFFFQNPESKYCLKLVFECLKMALMMKIM